MKRLSDRANALLDQVHSRQGILARFRDDHAEPVRFGQALLAFHMLIIGMTGQPRVMGAVRIM